MAKNKMISAEQSALDLTRSNIDPESPVFLPMLEDLQGNILKGHGRRFAHHIFLQLQAQKIVEAKTRDSMVSPKS
jgi:hypothetical protein